MIEDGEAIVSLKIWSTKKSDRCGGFEIITNQSRKFSIDAGIYGDPYQPELGSRILVGIFGRAYGKNLFCVGFALLRRASAKLVGVQYPNISTLLVTTMPNEIDSITYQNMGPVEEDFTFDGSVTVTTEQAWSVTASMEASVSIEVDSGFPIIAEAKIKASLQVTASGSYSRKNIKTTKQSYSFPLKVPGNYESLQATAILYEGNINTRYTGRVVYILDTGAKFSYNVSGEYSGISASEVVVKVQPVLD